MSDQVEDQVQEEEIEESSQDDSFDTMSDEDFESALEAAPAPKANAPKAEEPDEAEVEESPSEDEADQATADASDDEIDAGPVTAPTPTKDEPVEGESESEGEAEAATDGPDTGDETQAIDFKAAYEKIMAPFKANGREIKLENTDEVVRLMQMGANYTKKMQGLQPSLKIMRMLENNDLLDQNKLSFLIDLDKKNPQAIQKLLKDAGIDPMDIDTSSEATTYQPGNHSVSDDEVVFRDVLDDVQSTQEGKETIALIDKQWDRTSKEAIYREPKILRIISEQRANGLFDRISAEMDRRKILGTLDTNTPFIEAYKTVGDDLHAKGLLVPKGSQPAAETPLQDPKPAPRVLETRVGSSKKAPVNGDKAKAAAASTSTPAPQQEFNPLALSDDEFLAQSSLRV